MNSNMLKQSALDMTFNMLKALRIEMKKTNDTKANTRLPFGIVQALALVFVLVITGCAADDQQRLNEASAAHQMGVAHLRDRQALQALKELVKAEELNPVSAEIKNTLAIAYMVRKEYAIALTKFEDSVRLDPTYSEAWNNLGALHLDRERYAQAVIAFDKALENTLYATREMAMANKGWSLYRLGKTAEAKVAYEQAIAIEPSYPLAHLNLGILYQDLDRHLEALESFDKAIEIYPGNAKAHLHRGISLFRMGNKEDAKLAFKKTAALDQGGDSGKSAIKYLNHLQ
jgi:type IV pilus assembly protein PilF